MFPNELLSLYPKGDRVLHSASIRMGIPPTSSLMATITP